MLQALFIRGAWHFRFTRILDELLLEATLPEVQKEQVLALRSRIIFEVRTAVLLPQQFKCAGKGEKGPMRFAKNHVIGGVLKSGSSIVGFVPLNEHAHNLTGSTQRRAQRHERQQSKWTGIVRVTDSVLPVPEHKPPHAMGQHNNLFSLQISLSEALEVIRDLVEVPSPVIRESLGLLPSQSFAEIIQALAVYVLLFPHAMKQPVSNLKRLYHGALHSLCGMQRWLIGLDRALTPDKTVNLQPRAQDAGA